MTHTKAALGLLLAVFAAAALAVASFAGSSARSGGLHATKECSQYFGQAGQFCTITSSDVNAIDTGMNVVYASAVVGASLDSDLVLDGPGDNNASGHVTLDLATQTGIVTFSGGTGRFKGFHARVVVTFSKNDNLWHWDGTYSFTPPGHDG